MTRTIETIRENQTIKCTVVSDFAEALCYNRQFKNVFLDKDALGYAGLKTWKKCAEDLRVIVLRYYVALRNNTLNDDAMVDGRRMVYCWLSTIFDQIGEVNGVKLRANQNSLELLFADVTKNKTQDSTELGLIKSKLSNARRFKRVWEVKSANLDENHEYVNTYKEYCAEVQKWEEKVKELEQTAGESVVVKTAESADKFRQNLERYLADVILNQGMKSVDEILAEEKALKEARKARAKARKAAKAGK